jgi:hypothetical protein
MVGPFGRALRRRDRSFEDNILGLPADLRSAQSERPYEPRHSRLRRDGGAKAAVGARSSRPSLASFSFWRSACRVSCSTRIASPRSCWDGSSAAPPLLSSAGVIGVRGRKTPAWHRSSPVSWCSHRYRTARNCAPKNCCIALPAISGSIAIEVRRPDRGVGGAISAEDEDSPVAPHHRCQNCRRAAASEPMHNGGCR